MQGKKLTALAALGVTGVITFGTVTTASADFTGYQWNASTGTFQKTVTTYAASDTSAAARQSRLAAQARARVAAQQAKLKAQAEARTARSLARFNAQQARIAQQQARIAQQQARAAAQRTNVATTWGYVPPTSQRRTVVTPQRRTSSNYRCYGLGPYSSSTCAYGYQNQSAARQRARLQDSWTKSRFIHTQPNYNYIGW